MKEFMMLFINDSQRPETSPEEMQKSIKNWNDWIGGIAAQGKFVASQALDYNVTKVDANGVTSDGPFTEMKEIVGGYLIMKANNKEEVIAATKGCPIYNYKGRVEVREIMVFDTE